MFIRLNINCNSQNVPILFCGGPQTHCQDLRKRKNLELQILSEPVRGWEGDSMKSLGSVAYMATVHTQTGSSEVRHWLLDGCDSQWNDAVCGK